MKATEISIKYRYRKNSVNDCKQFTKFMLQGTFLTIINSAR